MQRWHRDVSYIPSNMLLTSQERKGAREYQVNQQRQLKTQNSSVDESFLQTYTPFCKETLPGTLRLKSVQTTFTPSVGRRVFWHEICGPLKEQVTRDNNKPAFPPPAPHEGWLSVYSSLSSFLSQDDNTTATYFPSPCLTHVEITDKTKFNLLPHFPLSYPYLTYNNTTLASHSFLHTHRGEGG